MFSQGFPFLLVWIQGSALLVGVALWFMNRATHVATTPQSRASAQPPARALPTM
ncbi:MAG: hypothetical protein JNK82_23870 [Myxococcaceae bacterium]|nr:hypothetical protein [Myxococcaceae bacterium]